MRNAALLTEYGWRGGVIKDSVAKVAAVAIIGRLMLAIKVLR